MFTGIVEETGRLASLERLSAGARLTILAAKALGDLEIGGSLAVNGCCLTAVAITPESFSADLSPETLDRTNLGSIRPGDLVNLERPLTMSSRLGGHFVQGHVDATGELLALDDLGGGNWRLRVSAPTPLLRYLVYKGSIAIDGVSLTIAALEDDVIEAALIPHTMENTNFIDRKPGQRVNLECDMLAKHVERLLRFIDAGGYSPAGAV